MKKIITILQFAFCYFGIAQSPAPIYQFNFNNTLSSTNGSNSFSGGNLYSFTNDRNGNASNALSFGHSSQYFSVVLSNLPQSNQPRSISFWAFFNGVNPSSLTSEHNIFFYGSLANSQAFGASQNNTQVTHWAWSNDHTANLSKSDNIWYHYTFVYDGSTSFIYRNGTLISQSARSWNTSGTTFYLGKYLSLNQGGFSGGIDELKIFNVALTQSQVVTNSNMLPLPTLTSISSTLINSSTATINYNIGANNFNTTSQIKYGITKASLNSVKNGISVTGFGATNTSENITGLTANTKYFFVVEAANANGTVVSAIDSFTTPYNSSKPDISNPTSQVWYDSAKIKYRIRPNFANTTSFIKYGTNKQQLIQQSLSINNSLTAVNNFEDDSIVLKNLTASTKYYFQVKASNSAGSDSTLIDSFTTKTLPTVILKGVASMNRINPTAHIYYSLHGNGSPASSLVRVGDSKNNLYITQNNGVPANGLVDTTGYAIVSSLAANTKYYYRVEANNGGIYISPTDSFITGTSQTKPELISKQIVELNNTSVKFEYRIKANDDTAFCIIRYGTNKMSLSNISTTPKIANELLLYSMILKDTLSNLVRNTKYYYVIEATNDAGTLITTIDSFTTTNYNINTNLLAYYNFENTFNSFNNLHNLSSGTLSSPTYVAAKYGQGVNFSGSQALINSTLSTDFTSSGAVNEFSICFWEYRTAASLYSSSYELFGSQYFRTKKLASPVTTNYEYGFSNDGTNWLWNNTATSYNGFLNGWHHFAIVLVNEGGSKKLKLYINGVLNSEVAVGAAASIFKFNNVFSVGGGTNSNGTINVSKYFTGLLDEMYIYSRGISGAEVVSIMNNAAGVLPTKITNFTVTSKNNSNQLNWTSENEINVAQFNIEYSTNAKEFETIGVVAAGKKEYNYTHQYNNQNDIQYYRLKVIDKDGKFTYSQIVKVKKATKIFEAEVYPTLVKEYATVSIATKANTNASIAIVDLNGKIINQKTIQIVAGVNTHTINISQASKGIYVVKIVVGNEQVVQKIVKQ